MRPTNSNQRWFAAAVCLLASSSFGAAQEGIVRMSDAATRPGVVKMNSGQRNAVQQTAYGIPARRAQPGAYRGHTLMAGANTVTRQNAAFAQQGAYSNAGYATMAGHSMNNVRPVSFGAGCGPQGYGLDGCTVGCGEGCGESCGDICSEGCCKSGYDFGSCNTRGRRGKRGRSSCDACDNGCYVSGYNRRMATLFAEPVPQNGCNQRWCKRWWRGQQTNYLARNQRLSNTLFGWMVPSGCGGQGCPPIGKYHVTYANDPNYADSRDGQAYGAQGYGVPVSVPLAPNVRHAYNYSWGTPASRISPIGQNTVGVPGSQQLYHQSW